MDGKRPPITLVLVSYNKADVIGKVIESVGKGSIAPDLLVVSDDGSTDGTPEAAMEAARKSDIPCKVLNHPRIGPYRLQTMRNSGVANALEGVVFISDSDCLFGPFTLETHLAIHLRHEASIATGPRYEFLEGTSGPFTSMYCTLEFSHFPQGNYLVPFGANMSFKKSLWRLLGGFDRIYEGSYGLDDHEFCLRAELLGASCISDPGGYLIHCPHETIFGNRRVSRNWNIFHDSFGLQIGEEEWWYVHRRVAPWYWRGKRKPPILGDKISLNEWGAPPGFHPPFHLKLSRTLEPLLQVLRDYLLEKTGRRDLVERLRGIHLTFIPQTSPAFLLITETMEAIENGKGKQEIKEIFEKFSAIQAASPATEGGEE